MKHFGKKIFALALALMCIATVGAVSALASGFDYPPSQSAGFSKPRRVSPNAVWQMNSKTKEEYITYQKSPMSGYKTVYEYYTPKDKDTVQIYGIKNGSSKPNHLGTRPLDNPEVQAIHYRR
ncbi:MAG: hypothetical protein ACI4CC_04790 [Lachnospiraceae bacterium]